MARINLDSDLIAHIDDVDYSAINETIESMVFEDPTYYLTDSAYDDEPYNTSWNLSTDNDSSSLDCNRAIFADY